MIVVIMPLDGATVSALLSFPFPSLSAAVNKVDLRNWSEVLEVNADEVSYTSAGQTFVCLENNKLQSFLSVVACLAQKVVPVSGHCESAVCTLCI